ncbi:MAG: ComEA family DNA-binding protein [Woeseiaceae bacterium]
MITPVRMLVTLIACLPLFAFAGPVDINTADAETIAAELNGIGLAKAKEIVEYRQKYGPFKSAEDLSLVKGVGEKTVAKNRDNIRVAAPKKK